MRLRWLGLLCVAAVVTGTLSSANAFAAFRLRVEDGVGNGLLSTDREEASSMNGAGHALLLSGSTTGRVGPTPGASLSAATTIDFLRAGQIGVPRNTLAAPEPRALALFGAGLLGIVHIARRRRRGLTRRDV